MQERFFWCGHSECVLSGIRKSFGCQTGENRTELAVLKGTQQHEHNSTVVPLSMLFMSMNN